MLFSVDRRGLLTRRVRTDSELGSHEASMFHNFPRVLDTRSYFVKMLSRFVTLASTFAIANATGIISYTEVSFSD